MALQHRLILIEGIPGSGKTTLAERLERWLQDRGEQAVLYREGDAHPADMAWQALLTADEYVRVLDEHPHLADRLATLASPEDGHWVVPYTQLGYEAMGPDLIAFFAAREVYGGKLSLEAFADLHRKRWTRFADRAQADPDRIVLFECSYLQNHVNELLLFHDLGEEEILAYLDALAEPVMPLCPLLLYLDQPDPAETIRRVARSRVSPPGSGRPDWAQLMAAYIENSPYGKSRGIQGFEDGLRFVRDRKQIEMAVWPRLRMDRAILQNPDYDWDAVFASMTAAMT